MYQDRTEAGAALARDLEALKLESPVVLALPRGGVPVALPVAKTLGAPLDLVLVRKIGVPGQPELAAGAMVDGPPEQVFWNRDIMRALRLSEKDMLPVKDKARTELARRREVWGAGNAVPLEGRDAIVIDDGIATGATMRAALMALRARNPARIILAVPVAARDTLAEMASLVDEVVCPLVPDYFHAVGLHYRRFDQVPDAEVGKMMALARDDAEN